MTDEIRTDNAETLENALARIEGLEIQLAISEHDREHDDYELTEVYKKVTELEKENAELKEKLDFITKNAEPAGKMLVDMVKREAEKAEQGKLAELVQEKYNLEYKIENLENKIEHHQEVIDVFKKKNAELKSIADFQTSSNMDRYFQLERSKQQLAKTKDIIKRLLENRPDTYSGTDVMVNQAKMFAFDSAVKDAVEYLKELDK